MINVSEITNLTKIANQLRKDILQMLYFGGSGHAGGALSSADLVAALYFHELKLDPSNPEWRDRDIFVLSKGHSCPVLYAALAEKGFFPKEWFTRLRQINGELQGHPDRKKTPGVEFNSGSLAQGFSFSIGAALGMKYQKRSNRVYALLGCGEMDEGQIWEGALFASHNKLDNLLAIVDYNKLQSDNYNKEILGLEPIADKWTAFGWNVLEIDGHNFGEIISAFNTARGMKNIPTIIIAHTIKGKGVSFMENNPKWHGSLAPTKEELALALGELEK